MILFMPLAEPPVRRATPRAGRVAGGSGRWTGRQRSAW